MRQSMFVFAVIALGAGGSAAVADPKKPTYDEDVLPVLKLHCAKCHDNEKQKGGLNLATYAALQQGGSSGVAVVAGNPDKSRLYTLTMHAEEPKMPPNGNKIPDGQLALIKTWIEQGTRENSGSKMAVAPKPAADIGLKSVVKGRPTGPPPMPLAGKFKLDPVVKARRAGAVLALAASPWAPVVAVGGQKQVVLYNTDNGQLLGVLPFDHGQINSIKFSRNAAFLLVAGGRGGQSGKAVLYRVATGEKVIEVGTETDAVLAADISADQTQIAVGGPSKLIRIYSTTDGTVLREIKKHTDWVTAVEFSSDGVLLATGDRNGGLFVWEGFTGREFFSLRGHTAMISDVSWRDDSNVLASCSEDGGVRLWEMENGNGIKTWAAHPGGTSGVRFTHDGKLASTGRDRVTKLWDQNGAVQKQFEAFPDLGLRVTVSHDNARVIGGDWSGVVKAWTVADAKTVAVLDPNPGTVAERLKAAEAAVVAAETKAKVARAAFDAATGRVKAATDAANAAQANLIKITTDLAAAQKAVTDNTTVAKAGTAVVATAKAQVDKLTAACAAATKKATDLEAKAKADTEAVAKAKDAAVKSPDNKELAAASKKAADALTARTTELAAAKLAATDAAAALKTATDKHAESVKVQSTATTAAAEAQKKVTALQPQVKPATDAIAPAKKAIEAANPGVAPAKAALDAATADLLAARVSVELMKVSANPLTVVPPPPKK